VVKSGGATAKDTNGSGIRPRDRWNSCSSRWEKSTQVRRTGLDQVLAELEMHRERHSGSRRAGPRSAWLCNSLSAVREQPERGARPPSW